MSSETDAVMFPARVRHPKDLQEPEETPFILDVDGLPSLFNSNKSKNLVETVCRSWYLYLLSLTQSK